MLKTALRAQFWFLRFTANSFQQNQPWKFGGTVQPDQQTFLGQRLADRYDLYDAL